MSAQTSDEELASLVVREGDRELSTRAAGWWLAKLGAIVQVASDPVSSRAVDPVVGDILDRGKRGVADPAQRCDVLLFSRDGEGTASAAASLVVRISGPEPGPGDKDHTEETALWARSGLASLTSEIREEGHRRRGAPSNSQPSLLAGVGAAIGVAATVVGKQLGAPAPRTLEIDKHEVLATLPMQPLAYAQLEGRAGSAMDPTQPGGVVAASDGPLYVRPVEPVQWERFLRRIPGMATIVADIAAEGRNALARCADEINDAVRTWAAARDRASIVEACQRDHVPIVGLHDVADVVADSHLNSRGFFPDDEPAFRVPWIEVGRTAGAARPAVVTGLRPFDGLPLNGLRVLDLTWAWAGPFSTTLLADLGAEVINVEWHPRPSNLRTQPPFVGEEASPDAGGWWSANQRGKFSVGVNLKSDEGRGLVHELAATSHLVVENFSPGVVDRLGVGYHDLREANPGLVYVSMSAFGRSGPHAHFVGYGPHIYAASGAAYVATGPDGAPTEMEIPYADPVSGFFGALAALAALDGAIAGQGGAHLDVSELECMCALLLEPILAERQGRPLSAASSQSGGDGGSLAPTALEVVDDPRLESRGFWTTDESRLFKGTGTRIAAPLWVMDGLRPVVWRGAPELFGDTRAVLERVLGHASGPVDALIHAEAIA